MMPLKHAMRFVLTRFTERFTPTAKSLTSSLARIFPASLKHPLPPFLLLLISLQFYPLAQAQDTELQFLRGDLTNAFTGADAATNVITFQHASNWDYGENFFFIDYLASSDQHQFYGEWYPSLSSSKMFAMEYPRLLKDLGLVVGINMAPEVNARKYLPGLLISWNLPGFAFFKTMLTGYIDDSEPNPVTGLKEENGVMLDIAWKYPFSIGEQDFSIEGHVEYIDGRGYIGTAGQVESWILAQPQLRWDLGKALFQVKDKLYAGVEVQYWDNKLGGEVNEKNVLALLVWQL